LPPLSTPQRRWADWLLIAALVLAAALLTLWLAAH